MSDNFPPFVLVALLLVSALLAVTALKIMRLPTIPAYFIAGIFAGSSGLDILHSGEVVDLIAEFGIILLLFTIGLKFNISTLHAIRRFVFLLGGMQVAVTALVIALIASFFFDNLLLIGLLGFVAAMSSTAIVSQILIEESEVTSPVGRRAMGVLLFQDLLVIPLIIIYSAEKTEISLWAVVTLIIFKTVLVLAFVLLAGPRLMKACLAWAARYGDKELFILAIVAIIAVSAMITGAFGLSYVLGSFLSGMLIAETFHRHRVEQIIEPFRQLFLGFFFMSLGILINIEQLIGNASMIILLALAAIAIKAPIVYLCTRIIKTHNASALRVALLLGGTGEFGFVLLTVANSSGILSDALFQLLIPANMLALITTPFLWTQSDRLVDRFCHDDWLTSAKKLTEDITKASGSNNHVIVCGFGRTGQAIIGLLRIFSTNFLILEDDYVIVEAAGETEKIIYGSSDQREILLAAGIIRAKVLIVTFSDPVRSSITVQTARQLNRNIHILAKTSTAQQAQALVTDGADKTLIEAHESGFSLVEQCLQEMGHIPSHVIQATILQARRRQIPLFQGQYTGTESSEKEDHQRHLIGCKVLTDMEESLSAVVPASATVVAWRRDNREIDINQPEQTIRKGDDIVLMGEASILERVKTRLTTVGEEVDEQNNG